MNDGRFGWFTKSLATLATRRGALGALLAAAGAARLAGTERIAAQSNCKPRGARCSARGQCCTLRCERRRRPGPQVCILAFNQGICIVGDNVCPSGSGPSCGQSAAGEACHCYLTTHQHQKLFCAVGFPKSGNCGCETDEQCAQRLNSAGARCVEVSGTAPGCATCAAEGTACIVPCPNLREPT